MHHFKQFAVSDAEAAAAAIPTIVCGPFFAGEPGALKRVASELAPACES